MTRRLAMELSKLTQIFLGQVVSRQVQHGVLQGARVSVRQDESVTAHPLGRLAAVLHVLLPQQVRHGSAAHGSTGMTRTGSFGLIGRDGTNRVHTLLFEILADAVGHFDTCLMLDA